MATSYWVTKGQKCVLVDIGEMKQKKVSTFLLTKKVEF